MKDGESVIRSMTLGKLCQIVELGLPEGFSADMPLKDVLGSSIAVSEGSAAFIWKTGEADSRFQVTDALEKKAAVIFCAQNIKDRFYPDEKKVVGVGRPADYINRYMYFARHCFDAKVIAVTGSLGKTTTTSMIRCVLEEHLQVHCGGTIDNSKGAILRLTQQIKNTDDVYLQEVGAAEPGHVESIAAGLCPDVAVITNVTDPHIDKYKTRENILYDKAALVRHLNEGGAAFFDLDNDMLRSYKTDKKVFYYAIDHKEADYYAENIAQDEKGLKFDVVIRKTGRHVPVNLKIIGSHNVRNALCAFAVGTYMGVPEEKIVTALSKYEPDGQRQNLTAIGGYKVLLDMFNSAPESLINDVKLMEDLKPEEGGRRILIVGDMARLGAESERLHKECGMRIAECDFDFMYCYGGDARFIYEAARDCGLDKVAYTDDREVLNNWIRNNVTRKDITLYKASQTVALAKTVDSIYGTTYYHGLQGVFLTYETVTSNNVSSKYRHVGDYLEYNELLTKDASSVRIREKIKDTPVRRISFSAFTKCRQLEEVVIPDSVVNIGRRAFYICPKLKRVRLPENLLMIEVSAFNYCRSLTELKIPDGVVSIGGRAFYDCISLTSLYLPKSIGYIGDEAFDNCPKLTAKVFENSYAHEYCKKNRIKYSIIHESDEGTRFKKADVTFEKERSDYWFKVKRRPVEDKPRYQRGLNGWEKKSSSKNNEAVIMCAGDLMCEPLLSESAYCEGHYDFKPMFKRVRDIFLSSDLAIANLETLVTESVPYAHEMHVIKHSTGPRYHCNAPLAYFDALRFAGFDAFVLANNHVADGGYDGLMDTIDNLDRRGFMRTGSFRHGDDPRALIVDVNGIRVGLVAYTEHINRKLDQETFTAEGCETLLNHFSEDKLKADIAYARGQGAEFLIGYIHFLGKDYSHDVVEKNVATATIMAEAGIDCVMGSHMHAVQKYDVIRTKDGRKVPVIYSLGNFISSDSNPLAKESVVYRLVIARNENGVYIKDESYIPFYCVDMFNHSSYAVFPTQKSRRKLTSELLDDSEKAVSDCMGGVLKAFE